MQHTIIAYETPSGGTCHPPCYTFLGVEITIHLTNTQTGGRFSLIEARFLPGTDSGLHLRRQESESLHVLEGRIALQVGTQHLDLAAGQSYFIARRTPHRIRNGTDRPARILAIHTAGYFDRLVDEVGTRVGQPIEPATPDYRSALAVTLDRYGIEIVAPPPAD